MPVEQASRLDDPEHGIDGASMLLRDRREQPVVVLGEVGRNVAAGMTGGELYVHDPAGRLPLRLNGELVTLESPTELDAVRELVARHARYTGSGRAAALLADWDREARHWWRVAPVPQVATEVEGSETSTGVA